MYNSSQGEGEKKKVTEIKTFSVPFALEEIKENISISTNTSSIHSKEQIINQAFKLHSQGKLSEAEKCYTLLIDQGYSDARVFSNYGSLLKSIGKLKEAEIFTRKAIELNPDLAEVHSNLGGILRSLGESKEAEIYTRKAIELNPNFANAHYNLGGILRELGNLAEAEISTRKAIEINPNFANAHYNLGGILKDIGKLKEAKNSYKKVKILKPNLDMNISFSSLYLKEKNPKKALIFINKFLEKNPTDTRAIAYKTIALRGVNKFNEAKELINFPKLVKKIYSHKLINEDILQFNKQFRDLLLVDPRRTIENNKSGWAIRGGTVIRELFKDTNNPLISKFQKILFKAIEHYIRNLPTIPDHPFLIKKINQYTVLDCWVNFLEPGDFQANHIHNNGWLSGVYYLDEPKIEKNKSHAGWIEFNRSGYNLPHFGGEKEIKSIKPEVGMFIFFPSYIWHGTIPYTAAYTRGSISFDITIK